MGSSGQRRLDIEAEIENLDAVTDFVAESISSLDYSAKELAQIRIVSEELFTNISNYAYPEEKGMASVMVSANSVENSVEITFTDNGIKYNPLESEEPDITLPAGKRQKGGLGLFFVKKKVDEMDYRYEDGRNILRIKKTFTGDQKNE